MERVGNYKTEDLLRNEAGLKWTGQK